MDRASPSTERRMGRSMAAISKIFDGMTVVNSSALRSGDEADVGGGVHLGHGLAGDGAEEADAQGDPLAPGPAPRSAARSAPSPTKRKRDLVAARRERAATSSTLSRACAIPWVPA